MGVDIHELRALRGEADRSPSAPPLAARRFQGSCKGRKITAWRKAQAFRKAQEETYRKKYLGG